jgi:hypothetical protein
MILKKHLGIPVLALALSALAAAPVLYGQERTWAGSSLASMIDKSQWKLGPFRGNASLSVANAGYESDIYYGYLQDAVPDFTLSATVPVQVFLPLGKKVVLEASDSPQYLFYLKTRKERAWNNTIRGQLHFALDRFYFQASAGNSNVRQRLSSELDINVRLKEDRLNGTLLYQASQRASFAFLARATKYEHEDTAGEEGLIGNSLDRWEQYFDCIVYIQSNSQARFFVDGQYGTSEFTEAAESFKNARSYGIFGGLDFIPESGDEAESRRIQGRIGLGYMKFDMIDPERADGSGFMGNANISARMIKKTTLRAFFSRGFQYSIYSGATYYVSTNFGGGVGRLLKKHIFLSYDVVFSSSRYPEDTSAGGVSLAGVYNRFITHLIALNFQMTRALSVTFLSSLGRRAPDATSLARKRNFFGLSLVYGEPVGIVAVPTSAISR